MLRGGDAPHQVPIDCDHRDVRACHLFTISAFGRVFRARRPGPVELVLFPAATRAAHRRRQCRGATMVEFAFVGPLAFLLLLGIVVAAVVILHEVQLTQAVRSSARGVALCGTAAGSAGVTATLPDGTACTGANLLSYINGQVTPVDPGLSNQAFVTVYCNGTVAGCANGVTPAGGTGTGSASAVAAAAATCLSGYTIEVSITYYQSLFVPLVGNVLGSSGGPPNTRKIVAAGEAAC